ncbi:hypothetical protein ACHAWF_010084 [Thalassiosira exigua]
MKNLALQGEVRHVIPSWGNSRGAAAVSVVDNDVNLDIQLSHEHLNGDYPAVGGGCGDDDRSNQAPLSFVLTSEGNLLALDSNDQMVWIVDLEKVADDSNEESEDDHDNDDQDSTDSKPRSQWFYAASFLQEHSSNMMDGDGNAQCTGIDAVNGSCLYLTCLSHDGHVVSVSIDATNSIASKGGIVEEGSECIGTFENGLECGGWSPDGEVLALLTFASDDDDNDVLSNYEGPDAKVPILMTMNTQYEILSEVRLDPCLVPLHSNGADSIHPNAISICWRPDSSSLAVSTMDANVNNKPLRRIKTYNRTTLNILSLSKEEDGSGRDVPNLLPVAPVWAPAGCSHYVGAIQSSRPLDVKSARARPVSMQVAFMEPNGLRHRECKIQRTVAEKTDREEVMGIAFNLEGDLLAVTSRVSSGTPPEQYQYGKVQLYHRSNYQWYLKYELRYDGNKALTSRVVSAIKFSEEDPYNITVALTDYEGICEWRSYTFRWESSTVHDFSAGQETSTRSEDTELVAFVVDGSKLNFTPFGRAIIPPPMYAASVELPAPVVGMASNPCPPKMSEKRQPHSIIALSDGKLALLQFDIGGNNGVSLVPGFRPPIVTAVNPSNDNISDEKINSGTLLQGVSLRDVTIIAADDSSFTIIALGAHSGKSTGKVENCGKHHFQDYVFEMKISWTTQIGDVEGHVVSAAAMCVTSSLPLERPALRLVNWSDMAYSSGAHGGALLELTDGTLLEYSQGGVVTPCEAGPILEACPWIAGLYNVDSISASFTNGSNCRLGQDGSPKRLIIGLSSRYRLYCGERLVSSASSSFAISLQHKFLTHVTIGSRPELRFLPLSSLSDFDPLMGSDENMALDGYEPRNVERGARIVAIFQLKPSMIVQMPRGNIETLSPRALVLPYVMKKIQEEDFRTALDVMRRQRVDMNLIVDFDAPKFLEDGGAEQFIGQIEKIDNINLFLSSLIDVDTTLWKYPVPSWIRPERGNDNALNQQSKVNGVCKKIRQVMLDAEREGVISSGNIVKEGHFLLPILSTFAKETPPKLVEALCLIKDSVSQTTPKKSKRKSVLLSDHVQSSIQYLAFLADYELIFNTAIGMYDFDLAKAVARHSQMDPKVYLPLLKRWSELPDAIARYEVDVKLKRYESALRHLVASCEIENEQQSRKIYFTKCLQFIEEHNLHKLGLELFKNYETNHRAIMISLGERLLSERKCEEAIGIFLAVRCIDGAMRAARGCGNWRTFFALAQKEGTTIESDEITAFAELVSSKVCSMSERRENFASAASIQLDYGQSAAGAVSYFISGQWWTEGRRIAHLHNRIDLAKKVVDGAITYSRACIEDLGDRASTFEKTNERYSEVIVIRRDAIKESEEAGVNGIHHDDSASIFSTHSTASNASLRSNASGSSVGSVTSVSTVISVGRTSAFSFTGDVDSMKHKSKVSLFVRWRHHFAPISSQSPRESAHPITFFIQSSTKSAVRREKRRARRKGQLNGG